MQQNVFKRLMSAFIALTMIMSFMPTISVSAAETCNHNMTHTPAKQATCINSGNVEYWHCDVCNKNFSDINGENELITTEKTAGIDVEFSDTSWTKEENKNITLSNGEEIKALDLYSRNMPSNSVYSGSRSITIKSGPGQLKLATTIDQGYLKYAKFTITITVNGVQKAFYNYTENVCPGYLADNLELTEAENTIVVTCNKIAKGSWADGSGRGFHVALFNTKDTPTQHELVFHKDYDCVKGGHEDYYQCIICGAYKTTNTPETDDNIIDALIVKEAIGSHNDSDNDGLCDACDYVMMEPDAENCYIISNGGQFNTFALIVNNGNTSANAELANDIDLSSSTFTAVGTNVNPFSGTFDGCGYTITVNQSGSKDVALFGKIGNCTIKNLKTTGTINTDRKFTAGIAMQNIGGTTANIENCISDVDIVSSINGDGSHGGIIGVADGTVNINNCGFTGSITGSSTNNCGGLVGWAGGSVSINNSYASATYDIDPPGGNTFARNQDKATLTNCYYLNPINETPSGATQVTAEQLASGEVCYKLNNNVSDGTQAWYQNIDSGSVDNTPIPDNSHNTVCFGYINCTVKSYGNSEKVSETPLPHSFTEYVNESTHKCANCDATGEHKLEVEGCVKICTCGMTSGSHDFSVKVDENNHKCANCDVTQAHSFEGEGCELTCGICKSVVYNHQSLNHILSDKITCANIGTIEHWHCDTCGKNFSDKKCQNEIMATNVLTKYSDNLWAKEENKGITLANGVKVTALDLYSRNMPSYNDGKGSRSVTIKSGPGQLKLATTIDQGFLQYGSFTIIITVNGVQKVFRGYTSTVCPGYLVDTLELTEAENTIVVTCNKTYRGDWLDNSGRGFHVALLNTKGFPAQHELVFHKDYDCVKGGHEDYYQCTVCGTYKTTNTPETNYNIIDAPIVKEATGSHNDSDNDGSCDACDYVMMETDAENCYIISNGGQFNTFASIVNNGNTSANAKLANDIDFGNTAFTAIGTGNNPFSGVFDGCGYTITVNQSDSHDVAPFGRIGNCTIKNLKTTGTINTADKFAAGIAMQNIGGTTANIENCISDVDIVSSKNGDGTHGGIIGVADGTVNINNCAFTGSMTGSSTNNCGGLVGWANVKVNINNSFVSAAYDIDPPGGNTFSRNPSKATLTNCYYLNPLNETPSGATQVTVEQLASGEVCSKLNNNVTDGTQAWYQNVDNGSVDSQPVLNSEHGTVYNGYIGCKTAYSNIKENLAETSVPHEFTANVDGNTHKCANCDLTEEHSFEGEDCLKTCVKCAATTYEHLSPLNKIPASDKLTCLNSVVMEHWHCNSCDKYFFDENGKKEWSGNIEAITQRKAVDIEYSDNSWTKEENIELSLPNGEKITALDLYSRNMPEHPNTGSRSITIKSGPGQLELATTVDQGDLQYGYFTITITVNGVQKAFYDYTEKLCPGYSVDTLELTDLENTIVVTCNKTDFANWADDSGRGFHVALLNTKDTITQHELVFHSDYDCITGGHEDYYQCTVCGAYKTTNTPENDDDIIDEPVVKEAKGSHIDSDNDGMCDFCDYAVLKPDADGLYTISNAAELISFADIVNNGNTSANARLTADIDFGGREWKPIAPSATFNYNASTVADTTDKSYSGTFDGAGHTISNFTIRKNSAELTSGLFGAVSGTIKNLGIVNASFDNGGSYDGRFGGICGLLVKDSNTTTEGAIKDCYIINSDIKASGKIAGAIVGANYGGTISNCYEYNNNVEDHNRAGNLVGDNRNDKSSLVGTVSKCYSDKMVVGTYGGTAINSHTKTTAEFASGAVTYLLNGSNSDGIWKQTLGTDTLPNFTGKTVYYDENASSQQYYNKYIKGDVDDSGTVDKVDAAIVLKYVSNIDTNLSAEQLELADLNDDGNVDMKDVIAIIKSNTAA